MFKRMVVMATPWRQLSMQNSNSIPGSRSLYHPTLNYIRLKYWVLAFEIKSILNDAYPIFVQNIQCRRLTDTNWTSRKAIDSNLQVHLKVWQLWTHNLMLMSQSRVGDRNFHIFVKRLRSNQQFNIAYRVSSVEIK